MRKLREGGAEKSARAPRAGVARFAVLESRWARRSALSVKPAFDLVLAAQGLPADTYEYEMVASRAALREAAIRITRSERAQVLYLACHGNRRGELVLHGGEVVSRDFLARTVALCGPSLRGLYLGACFAGRKAMAQAMFEQSPNLRWVMGYSREIDFIDSTALDMMFFRRWMDSPDRSVKRIKTIVADVMDLNASLVARDGDGLGFAAYVRQRDEIYTYKSEK
jgi:hypothetical protein